MAMTFLTNHPSFVSDLAMEVWHNLSAVQQTAVAQDSASVAINGILPIQCKLLLSFLSLPFPLTLTLTFPSTFQLYILPSPPFSYPTLPINSPLTVSQPTNAAEKEALQRAKKAKTGAKKVTAAEREAPFQKA